MTTNQIKSYSTINPNIILRINPNKMLCKKENLIKQDYKQSMDLDINRYVEAIVTSVKTQCDAIINIILDVKLHYCV